MTTTRTSPLDHPPIRFANEPFFTETLSLLRSVRDRAGWAAWFRDPFTTLTAMSAKTDSIVTAYSAVADSRLGCPVISSAVPPALRPEESS